MLSYYMHAAKIKLGRDEREGEEEERLCAACLPSSKKRMAFCNGWQHTFFVVYRAPFYMCDFCVCEKTMDVIFDPGLC